MTLYEDVRKAALDQEAAADGLPCRDGEGGLEANLSRYVGWLQYSAALGNGPASYELAHLLPQGRPAAPRYEAAEERAFKAGPRSTTFAR